MMHALRKKFIRITMLTVTAVMLVLCIGVNTANYLSTQSDISRTLQMITDNRGTIPKTMPSDGADTAQSALPPALPADQEDDALPPALPDTDADSNAGSMNSMPDKPNGPFTEETPYTTRYFVLRYDSSGSLSDVGLDNIASITEDDVPEYLAVAVAHGAGSGSYQDYQYQVTQVGDDRWMAVFLDCYQSKRAISMLAMLSVGVTIICIALVYIIVRICSKKAIEPMLKNAEKQKQFITDASHELKTPITVIATSLTVLEMEVGKQKWIDKAMAQTEKLKDLVNALVTLARMDEEESPLHFEPFDVSDAVQETAESFADFADSQGHALQLEIAPQLSYTGDAYAIRQLVSILLDNAVKYAAPGSAISLRMQKSPRYPKGILIQASNACENLDPNKLDQLFDRFYRSDESRSERSGFGIGLSIARSIAEGHHGTIRAESPDGKVIVFTAELR